VPHELKEGPESIELSATAPGREELFRAVLEAVLEAAYRGKPEGRGDGR